MRLRCFAVALALALAGCTGDDGGKSGKSDDVPRGGTLRIGVNVPEGVLVTLDPAKVEFDPVLSELHRCCLLRTLVNYRGGTTEEGGALLRPDLATALPEVSGDGLTYTFRLKAGLRYAPPFADVTIRAQDVVRAIEYTLRAAPPTAGFLLVIEGAGDFQAGRAASVAGLETPDDHTLVVHVTERVGDLAERFSFAHTAPVPPGADVGDRRIGRIPVSSGPYMVAGSRSFDFARAPTPSSLPRGFALGKRVLLVRNPSWERDSLRGAYPDRIVVTAEIGPPARAAAKVDAGSLDIAVGPLLPTEEQQRRYSREADLRKRLFTHVGGIVRFVGLNVALRPLDDVHVRKAINLVVDKQALREAARGGLGGRIATHGIPDALVNNLLLEYDPYETPGHRGDLDAARDEMRKSRYDADHDGRCDAAVCRGLLAPVRSDDPSLASVGRLVKRDLRRIGIELDLQLVDPDTYFGRLLRPEAHVAVFPVLGLLPNTLNAWSVLPDLFYGPLLGTPGSVNVFMVGASPKQLRRWKYDVRGVPSVDAKIRECLRLTARSQLQCWAETDQLLMERVVPWVPYVFEGAAQVVSSRVARFTFAQSSIFPLPAFDRIALEKGAA